MSLTIFNVALQADAGKFQLVGSRNSVFRRLWESITRDPSVEKFSTPAVNSPMEYPYRDEQVPIDIFLGVVSYPRPNLLESIQ